MLIAGITIELLLIVFIITTIKVNKNAYIENERRFNKEWTDKVVRKMEHIYNTTKQRG